MFSLRRVDPRVLWGILFIVGGVLFLLENLNLFPGGPLFWGLAFGVVGLIFVWVFISDRAQWWALIPGFTLLGIAAQFALDLTAPNLSDRLGGAIFLGAIGLSFWLIYASNRSLWWAVIPGGVLLTLATVAGIEDVSGLESGGVFFLGLGLTFVLLGLLPTPVGRMRWAFVPGGILLAMGLLFVIGFEQVINYLWPVALIVGGLALVWQAFRRR